MATCGSEGVVQVWCLRSGVARARYGVKSCATHVSLCDDWMAVGTADQRVHFLVLCEGGAVIRKCLASRSVQSCIRCVEVMPPSGDDGVDSASVLIGKGDGALEVLGMESGQALRRCEVLEAGLLAMRTLRPGGAAATVAVTLSRSLVVEQWALPELCCVRRCACPEQVSRAPRDAQAPTCHLASLSVHSGAVVLAFGEAELHWQPLAGGEGWRPPADMRHEAEPGGEGAEWRSVRVEADGPIRLLGGDAQVTLYLDAGRGGLAGAPHTSVRAVHTATGLALGERRSCQPGGGRVTMAEACAGTLLLSSGDGAQLTRPRQAPASPGGGGCTAEGEEEDVPRRRRRERKPKMTSQRSTCRSPARSRRAPRLPGVRLRDFPGSAGCRWGPAGSSRRLPQGRPDAPKSRRASP
ncbi:unnamed protein product [Prorocentrum cordatum]|uniref:Uncharacterized protein n=1 Tax=Prorocentrum cordatum TaxID=2364126 RepID=A0ABN9X4P8_9DINO|nr:unnamed protein product [Polarella glacialis]